MTIQDLLSNDRVADHYSHIDIGFLNRRLAMTALGPCRNYFIARQKPVHDHMSGLANDHLLVEMLLDRCKELGVPTLAKTLNEAPLAPMVMTTEQLVACPEVYIDARVNQRVALTVSDKRSVILTYHTSHIVSDTGRLALSKGYSDGYREAMVALLHDRVDRIELEPIVMGAPWLDHPRNKDATHLMWHGLEYGEILPEDITEFALMRYATTTSAQEWMSVMASIPESKVKQAIATLLKEPAQKDWGGEEADHFSATVNYGGRRHSAAFLLKGPTRFKETTLNMCGRNGDQIYRIDKTGADLLVVQHCHLVSPAVRETVRRFVVTPGLQSRKFCIIDGQASYRLLKAYGLLG